MKIHEIQFSKSKCVKSSNLSLTDLFLICLNSLIMHLLMMTLLAKEDEQSGLKEAKES